MAPDLWLLYQQMFRSRVFEEAVIRLWQKGYISGEMHPSLGEEAIAAGIVLQLEAGDAMALDHRGTCPLVMRGVDLVELLLEFMGHSQGLCCGKGGHMHLYAREYLAASSGIVGAAGPAAVGFALAARRLRPGRVALAFFGEGALNQGMLLEAFNLAVIWRLPVLFVCKDSQWAITTPSAKMTAGSPAARARGFDLPVTAVDGHRVDAVWAAAQRALERARAGKGPAFLHAGCTHLEGHFLGDPLVKMVRHPVDEMKKAAGSLFESVTHPRGGSLSQRAGGLGTVSGVIGKAALNKVLAPKDPLRHLRRQLESHGEGLTTLENRIRSDIDAVVTQAMTVWQADKSGGEQPCEL